jgi:chemosensory pili system protein ChpA (sensor histidine kinase/response regulator)
VKSFFPRLQRSARQASRLTAKRAELELSGGETLMDSEVLGQIVDPLMHLLRNAIDHGIEAPEARLAQGKDPQGRVSLEFLRDGSNILVRCSDDGAGLDFAAIRLAAERRGLLAEGEEASEEDLKNLILRPNFTTRQQATQTSGRGVGLDAVYSRIAELGGALTIKSSAGRGCVFDVRLPVTLLSSHALLVRAGGQTIALTSRGLEQIVHVEDGELRQFGSELVFQAADQIYPAQALDAVLGMPGPLGRAGQLAAYRSVLIVRRSAGLVAVLVESIVASRELVVKNLGAYIPKLRGIVGGTILGDGSVTPVIDVAELLREHGLADVRGTMTGTTHTSEAAALPLALVVDDSLSARRALAQLLSDSGFKVLTARDGMEAVETLENTSPDILFVDLEMPRMNGIELTMHVRAKPQMAKVPVIMVTSRSTVKHRQQAESAGVNAYITKPFADDMVLEHTRDLLAHA